MTEQNVTETLVTQVSDNAQPVTEQVEGASPPATSVEPVVEAKPEEDPKFAARFAALSRKERDIVQREQSIKQAQKEHQAFQQQLLNAKKDPIAYLQAAGFTLEQAIKQVINEGEEPSPQEVLKTDVDQIKAEIDAYKKQQAEYAAKVQEHRKAQEEASIVEGLTGYIESNPEKYELIMAYGAINDVWNVIKRTYMETGGKVHLTQEQAAEAVENDLLEQAREEAQRTAKLKKLQPESTKLQVSNLKEVSKTVSPTLTNQTSQSTTLPQKRMTREESIAHAARLLKWTDNK